MAAAAAVKVKGASHGLWISSLRHHAGLWILLMYCTRIVNFVIIYVLTRIVNILGHTMFYPQKQLQSITIQAILFTWSEFVRIQWTSISQPLAGYGPVIVPSTLIHNSVILCRDCIHQKLASFMVSVEKDTWQGGWGWAVVQMANHPGSSPLINSRNDLFSSLFGTRSRIMNTPLKPHSILKKNKSFRRQMFKIHSFVVVWHWGDVQECGLVM